MKIQIVSDVHLEWQRKWRPARVERDLLIVAGDLAEGISGEVFLRQEAEHSPVVYVPGNHEYYNNNFQRLNTQWSGLAADMPHVYFEPRGLLTVPLWNGESCRVACATLWSNFWGDPLRALQVEKGINDFSMITYGTGEGYGSRLFRGNHCMHEHNQARAFLEGLDPGSVDVVVTHFPPSRQSLDPQFKTGPYEYLNCYYSNDLDAVVERLGAKFWFHGHTHASADYMLGETRVICNPKGYKTENRKFNPGLVVEL